MKEPVWIDDHDALALHIRLLALHGGGEGLRDAALLQSALARPRQLYVYGNRPRVVELASAYTFGIVRNHPFVDGNKRVGFVVGVLFLELNGYQFEAPEDDVVRAVLGLAGGTLDEAGYTEFLAANSRLL